MPIPLGKSVFTSTCFTLLTAALLFGQSDATESRIPVGRSSLYARLAGKGQPLVVLHGGPDFDTRYLLPDFDAFGDLFRLIYYDQRGRGKSAAGFEPSDVTLASDVADIDLVRAHFKLQSTAVLGHSWGALLALEYALKNPVRVSHLILMNPAPVSANDLALMRKFYLQKIGPEMDRQQKIMTSYTYRQGEPEVVAARYRIHFKPAFKRAEAYEKMMAAMKAAFIAQGREGILKARAVELQLLRDSWDRAEYDLLPRLKTIQIPTLVIAGDSDFIPPQVPEHIASAIPGALLITTKNCGHFGYMECPDDVHKAVGDFLGRPR